MALDGPLFWALLLALLAAIGLLIGVGLRMVKLKRELLSLDTDLQRALAEGRHQEERLATLENLREAQATAEQVIAAGGSVVREVHKGIAAIPFDILDSIPSTRGSAKVARGMHDSIADGVYSALSGINKTVGREIRKTLLNVEGSKGGSKAAATTSSPSSGAPPAEGGPRKS
jgi:hypothetical protein